MSDHDERPLDPADDPEQAADRIGALLRASGR